MVITWMCIAAGDLPVTSPWICTFQHISTIPCSKNPGDFHSSISQGFLKVGRTMMRSQLDAIHRGEVFVA
jgi:hypothetical protein